MKIEIEVPDLPLEAAGYEVEDKVRHAMPNEWYFRREIHNDDPGRWLFHDGSTPTSGSYVVARKPKLRGLAFVESLEPGTVFAHEEELYWRGDATIRLLSPGNSDVVAVSLSCKWKWFDCTIPIDFCESNCRIIWPESKEQDQCKTENA